MHNKKGLEQYIIASALFGQCTPQGSPVYRQLRGKHTYKCSTHEYNKKRNSKSHNQLPFYKILSMM